MKEKKRRPNVCPRSDLSPFHALMNRSGADPASHRSQSRDVDVVTIHAPRVAAYFSKAT